jgi:hypothetical protein
METRVAVNVQKPASIPKSVLIADLVALGIMDLPNVFGWVGAIIGERE